jgi:medium-chain acyl-[acyl-carrier-protein] hydrolase
VDVAVLETWIPYRSENAGIKSRVFAFPHAAGNASFYLACRRHAPADIDICPLELPGHGQRLGETPFSELGALIATLQDVLEPLLRVPFAFFGHSTGACAAFEAARVLRGADGRTAVHLFVSARAAPGRDSDKLHSRSDSEVIAALRRYGGTPPEVLDRPDIMAVFLASLRADLALAASPRLVAGAPVSCPITVFAGADDVIEQDALRSWREFTTGRFCTRIFPGGHFYLADAPAAVVDDVVAELRGDAVDQATATERGRSMTSSGLGGRSNHCHLSGLGWNGEHEVV